MKRLKLTADFVLNALDRYYCNGIKYKVPNVYFFNGGYGETDLLIVKEGNNYTYDIEVKVSRSDFFADFKKEDKHLIITEGRTVFTRHRYTPEGIVKEDIVKETTDRPHRFYYAVPENLIGLHEVPKYAGVLYITETGEVKKMREAPLIHKGKIERIEDRLCKKFYYAFRELITYRHESGLQGLKREIQRLEKRIEEQRIKQIDSDNANRILLQENSDLKRMKYISENPRSLG